jgi:hypothetical protein
MKKGFFKILLAAVPRSIAIAAPGITFLLLLHSSWSWGAEPSGPSKLAQVWFGSFTNTLDNGTISHVVSALVLEQDGSKLSGRVGPSMDRLTPIIAGTVNGNNISFHIDGSGGLRSLSV